MSNYFYQLNEDTLKSVVPSVFSTTAKETMSSQYAVIPTIECIRGLAKEGFVPVKAFESRCRSEDSKPFVRHLIRFRHESQSNFASEYPEIIMINSHNGQSSYQLRAGFYRVVCSNGLIVGDDLLSRRVVHKGDVISKVVEAVTEIVDIVPQAKQVFEAWKGITLTEEEKGVFAYSAAMLKWDDKCPLIAPKLTNPRRTADTKRDLWTTFNVIQENLIRGGVCYYDKETRTRSTTRAVNSVAENSRLNTALWQLAESMARMKKSA